MLFSLHSNKTLTEGMHLCNLWHKRDLVSYLQPVWYLRQMRDPWLFVNKFSFVQVSERGPIKAYTEIGSEHPLVPLQENKESILC